MLREMLSRLAKEYSKTESTSFLNNPFGDFVRKDMAEEAKRFLAFRSFDLTIKASVGNGNWAATPWLAIFDPLITTSATQGFYVVFLINPQSETIYLSMNQGTTSAVNEFGTRRGFDILRRRAFDIKDRVSDHVARFDSTPISLGSTQGLPAGYEAGHAFGRSYPVGKFNPDNLNVDLEKMLFAYQALVDRGGLIPTDAMLEHSGTSSIKESRRYILSRRIERAPNVRLRVLSERGRICECCGLNPKIDYKYDGKSSQTPLDVHHATPLSSLAKGETRKYRIPDGFLVLCPNCHRMAHKQKDPSNLKLLKSKIGFRYLRDVGDDSL